MMSIPPPKKKETIDIIDIGGYGSTRPLNWMIRIHTNISFVVPISLPSIWAMKQINKQWPVKLLHYIAGEQLFPMFSPISLINPLRQIGEISLSNFSQFPYFQLNLFLFTLCKSLCIDANRIFWRSCTWDRWLTWWQKIGVVLICEGHIVKTNEFLENFCFQLIDPFMSDNDKGLLLAMHGSIPRHWWCCCKTPAMVKWKERKALKPIFGRILHFFFVGVLDLSDL